MMELLLTRRLYREDRTLGGLTVNGADVWSCVTLEDTYREIVGVPVDQWKVYGKTAIPMGRYRVVAENSPKFGMDTLTLVNVPGYTHIRIHSGNEPGDTDGCILVGGKFDQFENIAGGTSRPALTTLKGLALDALHNGEEVWLTIK